MHHSTVTFGAMMFAIAALGIFGIFGGCAGPAAIAPAASSPALGAVAGPSTTVFLVRHAEKGEGRDPDLTAVGHARAKALAALLRDADVRTVYSTAYARTQQTAAPLAARLGLEVQAYDPRALGALAEQLRQAGGTHVVVGHSNTTPAMVRQLGGNPDPPIDEKTEFDRLEVVTIGPDGVVTSVRLRVGVEGAVPVATPPAAPAPAAAPVAAPTVSR